MCICMCISYFSTCSLSGNWQIKLKNNDTFQQKKQQQQHSQTNKQTSIRKRRKNIKTNSNSTIPKGDSNHIAFLYIQMLHFKICKWNINSGRSSNVLFHNMNLVHRYTKWLALNRYLMSFFIIRKSKHVFHMMHSCSVIYFYIIFCFCGCFMCIGYCVALCLVATLLLLFFNKLICVFFYYDGDWNSHCHF